MRKVTLRSLLGHKLQLGLTVLAIALGVALVSGTLVLTSAMTAGSAVLPSVSQADVVVRGGPLEALPTIPGGQPSLRHPLPASVADRVAGLDGVAAVRRVASGPLSLLGQDGQPLGAGGDAALGTSLTDVPGLPAQVRLADGRLPASGEAVVDATTVREHRYAIGEDIQVVGADGRAEALTLTGTLQPGELPGRMVGLDLPTAQRLLGRSGQLDELQVAAAPGLRSGVLRDRVGAFAGSDYQVLTGVDLQAQRQEAIQAGVRSVGQTMVWFVIVSLLIGAFLIANAFTIMIAQRTHELALLRCLGATVPPDSQRGAGRGAGDRRGRVGAGHAAGPAGGRGAGAAVLQARRRGRRGRQPRRPPRRRAAHGAGLDGGRCAGHGRLRVAAGAQGHRRRATDGDA